MKLVYGDGTTVRLGAGGDVGRRRWKHPKHRDAVRQLPDGREVVCDVDVELTFAATMESFREYVEHLAFRYAGGDLDFAEDLMQEAWIKLWELDPLRFDAGDRGYVATALRNRMLNVVKRELRRDSPDDPDGEHTLRTHLRVA